MSDFKKLVIVGGGFAGIGCALRARQLNPDIEIIILEKGDTLLGWTRRKGLSSHPIATRAEAYRDDQPFEGWTATDSLLQNRDPETLLNWLGKESDGAVELQTGRILCTDLQQLCESLRRHLEHQRIELATGFAMESISRQGDAGFRIWSRDGQVQLADRIVLATGGERNHALKIVAELGAHVTKPVAGFVRLKLDNRRYAERMGPLDRVAEIRFPKSGESAIDHVSLSARGLEGPAISRLSSSTCRLWHDLDYRFPVEIDWLPDVSSGDVIGELLNRKQQGGKRPILDTPMFAFHSRSWGVLLKISRIDEETTWTRVRMKKLQSLAHRIKSDRININGMGLPDGERAWAGGIDFDCLDPSRLELLKVPGLFFAGEVLDFIGEPGGSHLDLVWASSFTAAAAAAATD